MHQLVCSFELDTTVCDEATWLVYIPAADLVIPVCGDHQIVAVTENPDAESVAVHDLPMTCAACGEPVWAKHADGHSTGQPCSLCDTDSADHPGVLLPAA